MNMVSASVRKGFTAVELLTTMLIVVILAASLGMFFAKLLTIQEKEREEAYVRERLADICALYADFLSVGATLKINTNFLSNLTVDYRLESGGVSFETGKVTRVAQLSSAVKTGETRSPLDLTIYGYDENGNSYEKYTQKMDGAALLIPKDLQESIDSCTLEPYNYTNVTDIGKGIKRYDGAALARLRIEAKYKIKNRFGKEDDKQAYVERMVRLWNTE